MSNFRIVGFAAFIAGMLVGCYGADLSSRVSQNNIRAIQLGMSPADVVALLGEPKTTELNQDGRLILAFSARVPHARRYPMLWVHFRNGEVVEVYAKRYVLFGLDDEGVYGLNDHGQWEADCFQETFPN